MSKNVQKSSASSSAASRVLHPVDTVKTTANRMPGATTVKGAFDGVLDTVGVVSPRSRRIAAYAGVGLLGAAGVVEWPVVAAGAAAVWLTQSRPKDAADAGTSKTEAGKTRPRRSTAKRSAGSAKGRATTKPRSAKKTTAKAKSTESTQRRASTTGSSASRAGG